MRVTGFHIKLVGCIIILCMYWIWHQHSSISASSSPVGISLVKLQETQTNRSNTSHVAVSSTISARSSAHYMIYYCDDICGGWAERLRRSIITYIIATLTGRVFGIRFDGMPCTLTDFLQPGNVNWDIPRNYDLKHGAVVYSVINSGKMHNDITSADLKEIFKPRVVLFRADLDYFFEEIKKNVLYHQQLKWMRSLTYDQIFVHVIKTLFRLSPKVKESLDTTLHFAKPQFEGGKLVCAHLRFTNNSEMLPYPVKLHTEEHGKTVLSFLQSLDPSNPRYNAARAKQVFASSSTTSSVTTNSSLLRFFVTGDSDQYIDKAAQIFGKRFVRTPNKFVHIGIPRHGEARHKVCDGLSKVIEDQQLLTYCDILVIGKSSFARQAAYLRGTDNGLYCILLSGQLVKCHRRHLRELYGVLG